MMEDSTFWPIPPGPEGHSKAELYRGYKRLVNNISERLHKSEVLSLAYQHDLPAWFVEIGPMHEPGYALRVLSQMEGRQVFSPTNLRDLSSSLDTIGRIDLVNMIKAFEEQHREAMEAATTIFHSVTPEPHLRDEYSSPRRTSVGTGGTRRYYQDTFREEKNSQSSFDFGTTFGRSTSENRSRHGSMDKCSMDRSREGTPFESVLDNIEQSIPQDVNLGIEMAKMSAETLGNQLHLVQQMLTNHCVASPGVHNSLTNAYLLTKQISSLLNIASDSIRMVPVLNFITSSNDQLCSPAHSRQNSLGEMKHNTSHSSLGGYTTGGWDQAPTVDVQKDGASMRIYRTCSQPQVNFLNYEPQMSREIRLNTTSTSSIGEKANGDTKATVLNQLSPLEFTDVAFGETSSTGLSLDNLSDIPPPLPPRPAHMTSPVPGSTGGNETGRHLIIGHSNGYIEDEQLSTVKKLGYNRLNMTASKSVQELNKLTDLKAAHRQHSKSLTRGREGSYSGRGFKLFSKKKISSG